MSEASVSFSSFLILSSFPSCSFEFGSLPLLFAFCFFDHPCMIATAGSFSHPFTVALVGADFLLSPSLDCFFFSPLRFPLSFPLFITRGVWTHFYSSGRILTALPHIRTAHAHLTTTAPAVTPTRPALRVESTAVDSHGRTRRLNWTQLPCRSHPADSLLCSLSFFSLPLGPPLIPFFPLVSLFILFAISSAARPASCASDPMPAWAPSCMRTTAARESACAGRSWPPEPTRAASSLAAVICHMHANPANPACSHAAKHRACSSLRLAPFVNTCVTFFARAHACARCCSPVRATIFHTQALRVSKSKIYLLKSQFCC